MQQRVPYRTRVHQLTQAFFEAKRSQLRDGQVQCRMTVGGVRQIGQGVLCDLHGPRLQPALGRTVHGEPKLPQFVRVGGQQEIRRAQDGDVRSAKGARLAALTVGDLQRLRVQDIPQVQAHRPCLQWDGILLGLDGGHHQVQRSDRARLGARSQRGVFPGEQLPADRVDDAHQARLGPPVLPQRFGSLRMLPREMIE